MAKLTFEDKKEIIRLYDEDHMGYVLIATKFNVNKNTIQRIVR